MLVGRQFLVYRLENNKQTENWWASLPRVGKTKHTHTHTHIIWVWKAKKNSAESVEWTSSQLCLHSSAVVDDAASTAKMGKQLIDSRWKKRVWGLLLTTHSQQDLFGWVCAQDSRENEKCRRVIKTWRSLSVESFERLPECCIQWIPFHGWLIKEMELSLSRLDFFFFFFLFLFDKGLY